MIKAVSLVINNRKYISEALAELLADGTFNDTPANPFDQLSSREFEIASMLLKGQQLSEIAKLLGLQASTVGTHKAKLFKKWECQIFCSCRKLQHLIQKNKPVQLSLKCRQWRCSTSWKVYIEFGKS